MIGSLLSASSLTEDRFQFDKAIEQSAFHGRTLTIRSYGPGQGLLLLLELDALRAVSGKHKYAKALNGFLNAIEKHIQSFDSVIRFSIQVSQPSMLHFAILMRFHIIHAKPHSAMLIKPVSNTFLYSLRIDPLSSPTRLRMHFKYHTSPGIGDVLSRATANCYRKRTKNKSVKQFNAHPFVWICHNMRRCEPGSSETEDTKQSSKNRP